MLPCISHQWNKQTTTTTTTKADIEQRHRGRICKNLENLNNRLFVFCEIALWRIRHEKIFTSRLGKYISHIRLTYTSHLPPWSFLSTRRGHFRGLRSYLRSSSVRSYRAPCSNFRCILLKTNMTGVILLGVCLMWILLLSYIYPGAFSTTILVILTEAQE